MSDRGGDASVLAVARRVPLPWLPEQYRAMMRAYLEHGTVPPDEHLRALLEGSGVTLADVADTAVLYALATAQSWIRDHLPPQCWGSRDQVQLWVVYLRRARGRAMLAIMEGPPDGKDAAAEARQEQTGLRHPGAAGGGGRASLRPDYLGLCGEPE